MSLYEILPIEQRGMSNITAVILFFLMNGYWVYFWWDRREHSRLMDIIESKTTATNGKITILFEKIEESNRIISEMNSHIAAIHESLEWIKKDMERKQR